ncbi:MAG: serine protease [Nitrospinota bacterium]
MHRGRRARHSVPRTRGGRIFVAALLGGAILGCAPSPVSLSQSQSHLERNLPAMRPDGGYDYNTLFVDGHKANLDRVLSSMVALESIAEFETLDGHISPTRDRATGIVIFQRFILTVDHAVTSYELTASVPNGTVVVPAKKLRQETRIVLNGQKHRLHALLRDRDNDIALFRLPGKLRLPSFPYGIGNSNDLKIGNFIYVVGNPMNMGLNVREGIVSNLRAPEIIHALSAVPANTFMVSNGLNPGDSGAPALAIRDGEFELVGLTQGTFLMGQRLGWVLRINAIMDKIGPYIESARLAGHPAP